jgi:3-phenylpropionate/trans-cinnamate dioxygenase ferredoxin reductase subunit
MGGGQSEVTGPDLGAGVPSGDLQEDVPVLGHFGDDPVLLVRVKDGVLAIGAKCTHYGGPLHEGVIERGRVHCPWHHACFDLRTGEALEAPALADLPTYRTDEAHGRVRVTEKVSPPPTLAAGAHARGKKPAAAPSSVVILGGGAAGNAAAEELRREGYAGPVVVVEPDQDAPCDRPNLSKDYLQGSAPEDWIPLHPPRFYEENGIEMRRATALRIDRAARRVELKEGGHLEYGALILALGAEPVRLDIPTAEGSRVFTLRTLADSRAIIRAAEGGKGGESGKRAVVLGASFIGLEVAASLRHRELEVHVVAPEELPLARVMGPDLGRFVKALHEEKGVRFHLGRTGKAIERDRVVLDDGSTLPADFVVVGVGVRPRVALAQEAGLEVDNGILVGADLRTSDPSIWAAGDVASFPYAATGERVRIEHWAFAERMGAAAARSVLGKGDPFKAAPFFWSQHYDAVIAYVGHAKTWDKAPLDGDPFQRDCAVRFSEAGRQLAVATIFRDRVSLEAEIEMERR